MPLLLLQIPILIAKESLARIGVVAYSPHTSVRTDSELIVVAKEIGATSRPEIS
jgi:hypothetical protein